MVDATPGTEETKVQKPTGATAPAEGSRPAVTARCKLAVGERWRTYQIEGPAQTGISNSFEATEIGRMEKVLISATLLNKSTALRRAVWEQLSTQLPPKTKILKCLHAYEEEGWRYEVTDMPSTTTLREWIACHQAEAWVQRQMLEQLTETLVALHTAGVVHLNIRPELIYLTEEGAKVDIILGGLETASLYKQASSIVTEIDPFYAPPEAVDPEGPQPGIGLCAWDWWSVGRVMQEIALGRHVMSMLFGSDVIRSPTPALRDRAKALLLEIEPPSMRAGAVESMPQLDPATKTMLRGLLSSARDARWKEEPIRLWLAKESVSNHYDLPRNTRFFTWKGQGRLLPEAAQFFRTDENWADGELNLFELNNPETLGYFLSTVPAHAADWKKLQEIQAAVESPEWSAIPAAARRSIATALAWLVFGPQPGALLIRGRRIDQAGLVELLGCAQDSFNLEIVKGLMSVPGLARIKPIDPAAEEFLGQLAAVGGEALRRAEQQRWVDEKDPGNSAYLLKLSLESDPLLRKKSDRIRNAYAGCQDVELAALLADKAPTTVVHLLLILTGENPRRFGFVTKVEKARLRQAELQARSAQLQVSLFWLNLREMLLIGRPWSGSWSAFLLFWLGVVVFGVAISRNLIDTTLWVLGLVGLRALLAWRVRTLARQADPAAAAWTWRDGPERCLQDAQRGTGGAPNSLPGVLQLLDETEATLMALRPEAAKPARGKGPRLTGLWPLFAAAAAVSLVGSIQLLKNLGQSVEYKTLSIALDEPDSGAADRKAMGAVAYSPAELETVMKTMPGLTPELAEKIRRGEYEIVKEAFGHTVNGPIQKWAFAPPAIIPQLPVESRAPATAQQRAYALVSGELLVRPYGQKGVAALLVVRVPVQNGFGLMVYNAKTHKLMEGDALTLREGLPDKTWYRFERFNVIYLGAPSGMDVSHEDAIARN